MKILALFFLFAQVSLASAEDVKVTATVDRNQVGIGDVINYTISISATNSLQVDEPRLTGLDGLELINTASGVETRSSFENGRFITQQSRNFTYLMAVSRQGPLTIPGIPVFVDGKTYTTPPVHITVSGERKGQQQQAQRGQQLPPDAFEQLDDMEELFNQMVQRRFPGAPPGMGRQQQRPQPPINPNDAFFVRAVTDKKKVFVGEQVVANFYLYTRGQIRDIDTLKYPELKGFWKEDLEMATRLNFEQIVENGIPYQRALLVSYALFPIKPGKAVVDSYRAKCTVLTPGSFGFGRPYVFTKASDPIELEVAEIPAQGRPSEFTGAVGRFRLNAQFEPLTGATNQPVTLRVRIEGQGNAKLIELPKLNFPPSFELYDQKNQAKYLKDGSSYKEFEVLFIPREPGVFDIPAIGISTFDPESKKFTHVDSQPLRLTVTGQGGAAAVPAQAGTNPGVSAPEPGSQLPALALDMDSSVLANTAAPAFTAVLYLVVFGFLGQQAWTKFRRKPKKASLGFLLKRRLLKVRELAAEKKWRLMGVEGTNAIYYILGQLSEQGGANQDLENLLEYTPPSLRNELAGPLKELLSQFEALSFAPEKVTAELAEKTKVQKMIEQLEKTLLRAIELAEI